MSVICNFEVLSDHECRRLLASHDVGRLAFMGDDGYPVMMPVNYVVEDDTIMFRTAPGETFESIPTRRVAFEVEGSERWSRSGWSVLVHGFGHVMTNADRSHHRRLRTVDVWAPGVKSDWLGIDMRRISGRRIRSATEPTSSQYGDVDE